MDPLPTRAETAGPHAQADSANHPRVPRPRYPHRRRLHHGLLPRPMHECATTDGQDMAPDHPCVDKAADVAHHGLTSRTVRKCHPPGP